jgi:hypothetical protein
MADIYTSDFESQRHLATRTVDGLDMVISTGYALFGMQGNPGGGWNRQTLFFRVGPRWTGVRGNVVVVSPSSMFNKNVANDAGWAVDRVNVTYFSQYPGPPGVRVELRCGLAVSDTDGILYRVNHHLTTIGQLAADSGIGLDHELTPAEELIERGLDRGLSD